MVVFHCRRISANLFLIFDLTIFFFLFFFFKLLFIENAFRA